MLPHVHSIYNDCNGSSLHMIIEKEGMQQFNQMHRIFAQTAGVSTAKCAEIRRREHAILCLYHDVAQSATINVGMENAKRLKAATSKQRIYWAKTRGRKLPQQLLANQ